MARQALGLALAAVILLLPTFVEAGMVRQADVAPPIQLIPRAPEPTPPPLLAAPSLAYASHTTSVIPDAALDHARALLAASQPAPVAPALVAAPAAAPVVVPAAHVGTQAQAPAPAQAPSWWLPLLWALPLVGVGGAAAVLAVGFGRRSRSAQDLLVLPARAPRPGRMAPASPDDLKGILHNGQVAAERGAYDEAVAWFETALRAAPKLAVAYFCKGVCLAASGRVADAYGALQLAVTEDPSDASYRLHFARVALALGKHKEAMDALELVARAMPELGPAMLEDPQLAGLRDHPRFLAICGAL